MTENQTTATPSTATDATRIVGISIACCHVDDFAAAYPFYADLLGLEKQFEMGENACYFRIGEGAGLYLEGGNAPRTTDVKSVRTSFTLAVPSAGAMFDKLKAAGVEIIQSEPMDMGAGDYWFQFRDPAGNILEILGGR